MYSFIFVFFFTSSLIITMLFWLMKRMKMVIMCHLGRNSFWNQTSISIICQWTQHPVIYSFQPMSTTKVHLFFPYSFIVKLAWKWQPRLKAHVINKDKEVDCSHTYVCCVQANIYYGVLLVARTGWRILKDATSGEECMFCRLKGVSI